MKKNVELHLVCYFSLLPLFMYFWHCPIYVQLCCLSLACMCKGYCNNSQFESEFVSICNCAATYISMVRYDRVPYDVCGFVCVFRFV